MDITDCLTLGQRRTVNEFTKWLRVWTSEDEQAIAKLRSHLIDFFVIATRAEPPLADDELHDLVPTAYPVFAAFNATVN